MLTTAERKYYDRQLILEQFNETNQLRLKASKILVIGAGGLGCPALQYLAGAGVGTIGIIDGDTVSLSNIHRQVLFSLGDIGKNKAICAAEHLRQINPYITIVAYAEMINPDTTLNLIGQYDIVLDCTDNYPTRYLVNDACYLLKKPLVYGSIYRFQGQVSVFHYQNGPTYRCLFPTPPTKESSTDCTTAGVIGVLPGIIGLLQATESIKVAGKFGNILSGKVLIYDAINASFQTIQLEKSTEEKLSSYTPNGKLIPIDNSFCSAKNIQYLTAHEVLENSEKFTVIDVREIGETPDWELSEYHQFPLSEIDEWIADFPFDKSTELLLFCQLGKRSLMVAERLVEQGYTNISNLKKGISSEINELWKQKITQ
jgi:sulfur-carrier protein adenylyltransferase/sulfurtransferase